MNKILVEITVPLLNISYEVWLPVGKTVGKTVEQLKKGLMEIYEFSYPLSGCLIDEKGVFLEPNCYIKNTGLVNGSHLVLL